MVPRWPTPPRPSPAGPERRQDFPAENGLVIVRDAVLRGPAADAGADGAASGGRLLYEALLARLADRGYRRAMAAMTLPNEASVYSRVGWKNGSWHDVAWVQKTILDAADPPAELH